MKLKAPTPLLATVAAPVMAATTAQAIAMNSPGPAKEPGLRAVLSDLRRSGLSSLRIRIIAAFLFVSFVIAGLAIAAVAIQLNMAKRASLIEARNVAAAIAHTGIDNVIENPLFLRRYVEGLRVHAERDIVVVDTNQRGVADANESEIGQIYTGDSEDEVGKTIADGQARTFTETNSLHPRGALQIVVPLWRDQNVLSGRIVGAVILEYTPIYDELSAAARGDAYVVLAVGLVCILTAGVFGWRVAGKISCPIADLERGVSAIAAGQYGAVVRVDSTDEIGSLGTAFNKMSGDLKETNLKLIGYRHDLEQRVAAITDTNARLKQEIQFRLASEKNLQESEGRLTYLANYDVLTGLPNRHLLHDSLTRLLALAERNSGCVGILFVDLDRFKDINDTFGHNVGDELLVQVSERLRHCVRSADVVGRRSGDEFSVVIPDLSSEDDATIVAQKMHRLLSTPFNLDEHTVHISASVGIALFPKDGTDADTLLKNADTAMYSAKAQGRNCFRFYLPEMNDRLIARLRLEAGLRGALERGEFHLHHQPKVSLTTGAISGFEALLRWSHPERGSVPPTEFIPVLEDTGLIVPVGLWVLQTACSQLRTWQLQGIRPCPISVNVSGRQFDEKSIDALIICIEAAGVDPTLLKLELTESMLMEDAEETIRTLSRLKASGVQLSVDDFGTGYSSLAYLNRFPLDEIKIDRAFIRNVTTSPDDAAIALAIVNLGHSLRLTVVAEGVETAAQLSFLCGLGCDEMQGYYFARPTEVSECTKALLEERRMQLPRPHEYLAFAGSGADPVRAGSAASHRGGHSDLG